MAAEHYRVIEEADAEIAARHHREPHYLMPAQAPLDPAEEHVRRVLESRLLSNASGQRGEDVENIRAAYAAGEEGKS